MILQIDVRMTPPTVKLLEADDFGSLKTVVVVGSDNWASPESLVELGGEEDPSWRDRFEAMVAAAREHGWTDERGWVRSHVELVDERAPR